MSITREEAITKFEEIKLNAQTHSGKKYAIGCEEYYKTKIDLAEAAISALRTPTRERIEKAWRGGWIAVRESEITGFNPEFAGHDPIGGYKCSRCKEEAVLDCNDEFVLDNFCPRCGAAMTDEAVEMVMERMEALKDGSTSD